jgi:putative ATP-dependent endonuclease of the OLD family
MEMNLEDVSLKVRNFKCFAAQEQGFDRIKPINVIIGRNNSGKSTLLDLVGHAVARRAVTGRGHKREVPEVFISLDLTDRVISTFFTKEQVLTYKGRTGNWNLAPYNWAMDNLKGRAVKWTLNDKGGLVQPQLLPKADHLEGGRELMTWLSNLTAQFHNPFSKFQFRRILADRDVVAEASNSSDDFLENGAGVTNVIQRYINRASLDRDLIEGIFLEALNEIMRPDSDFVRIVVQLKDNETWEIFLHELNKGRIPMSETGSGLKTVLLVLANIVLLPAIAKKPLSEHVFCFEELENNLHPAIQRRLFRYLREKMVLNNSYLFVTTHSHVVIDMFSNDDQAQILHVTHDGTHSKAITVDTHASGCGVLDDLDIRASDLLQTNVVVWVEGPSDRFYFSRWVELWSERQLIEGVHYQCLPFGGSCNAHFSFHSPEHVEDLIPALKINRHAILLIDRDRDSDVEPLKVHTQRLVDEIQTVGGYAWVTKGREVENYIPLAVFQQMFENSALRGPGEYSDVLEYVGRNSETQPPRKTDLAHQVVPLLSKDHLSTISDLPERLDTVCELIRKWNRLT